MHIQVIGARGMLGQAVCQAVVARGHTLYSAGIDITRVTRNQVEGECVINCAGIVKGRLVADSEYMRVNAYGVHRLAEACDEARTRLVHMSTDCVFNDSAGYSRMETSWPTPNDIYSHSKLAGEVIRSPHLTVRSSFIGHGARGLLHDLMIAPRSEMVIRCQHWSGHTVETLADVLVTLAEHDRIDGLLHVPGQFQTRKELIDRLSEKFNLGITVTETLEGYDRRLKSFRWFSELHLPILPTFAEQLARLE